MLLINPVVCMLFNQKLKRWHPIVFKETPLPGLVGPARHKSHGHHTTGFATRDEAVAEAKRITAKLPEISVGYVKELFQDDVQWDGEDLPAMVMFFSLEPTTPLSHDRN